jgi:hypothetical protein
MRLTQSLGPESADQPTRATRITGEFQAPKAVYKDVYTGTITANTNFVTELLAANLYVTGAGPHTGTINIWNLYYPHTIDVTGSMMGSIHTGAG